MLVGFLPNICYSCKLGKKLLQMICSYFAIIFYVDTYLYYLFIYPLQNSYDA